MTAIKTKSKALHQAVQILDGSNCRMRVLPAICIVDKRNGNEAQSPIKRVKPRGLLRSLLLPILQLVITNMAVDL